MKGSSHVGSPCSTKLPGVAARLFGLSLPVEEQSIANLPNRGRAREHRDSMYCICNINELEYVVDLLGNVLKNTMILFNALYYESLYAYYGPVLFLESFISTILLMNIFVP